MKKPSSEGDDLLPEYDFDYAKARSSRFASDDSRRTVTVLDENLSKVFTTAESVNKTLRALVEAIPSQPDKDAA